MALPVIDVPTFDIEVPGIKDKIKLRPFLVKENKILTLATASEDPKEMYNACCQVIEKRFIYCCEAFLTCEFNRPFSMSWSRAKSEPVVK